MSISATSLTNTVGTGFDLDFADVAKPTEGMSRSVLRFEQSLGRAEVQKVAFIAPGGVAGAHAIDSAPRSESFFLAQATPLEVPQSSPGSRSTAEEVSSPDLTVLPPTMVVPNATVTLEGGGTGQGIIDGLSRLRSVFDAQEQAITGISTFDGGGARLTNSTELINLQLEVVKYSTLMDVTSKLAGKSTQTFDTLMKGQ